MKRVVYHKSIFLSESSNANLIVSISIKLKHKWSKFKKFVCFKKKF